MSTDSRFKFSKDDKIFKYIKPDDNDKLSKMDGVDLQDLLVLIDDYYLELRDKLGFKRYVTFGLELEFEEAMNKRIMDKLDYYFDNEDWNLVHDGSLINGGEIRSPILVDREKSWRELKKVCEVVDENAIIGENCGGHVHVGAQTLGSKEESWINFIKLWATYENIIFRFGYGEHLNGRPNIQDYARPLADYLWDYYKDFKDDNYSTEEMIKNIGTNYRFDKYYAFNLIHVDPTSLDNYKEASTIEFRCPNGTDNPTIWQNNVNLFVNLLEYAKSTNFDGDIVEKRHIKNDKIFRNLNTEEMIDFYDEIYLDEALELCDLVFTNNFDKVYFLKQYLKSFQICKDKNNYKAVKVLTRK